MKVILTEKAKERILFYMKGKNPIDWGLRVRVKNGKSNFALENLKMIPPIDETLEVDGIKLIVDTSTKYQLDGSKIDFVESNLTSGFTIEFKKVAAPPELNLNDPLTKKVYDVLEKDINPYVASHGGHIKLIDVKGDTVYVEMGGGCQGCGSAGVTLKQGIESRLKEVVPEIKKIIDTTDHDSGTNPYYAP
ncbi:MAG: NifU family protein [Deltaproteobacteria bacterium]|nr:NifU family protein [Deltaproteobacteria bacterium]